MYAYWVASVYNRYTAMQEFQLGMGQRWDTFIPGTAVIIAHPNVDIHEIKGDLFLRNVEANVVEYDIGDRVAHSGVFILARNFNDAKELL